MDVTVRYPYTYWKWSGEVDSNLYLVGISEYATVYITSINYVFIGIYRGGVGKVRFPQPEETSPANHRSRAFAARDPRRPRAPTPNRASFTEHGTRAHKIFSSPSRLVHSWDRPRFLASAMHGLAPWHTQRGLTWSPRRHW
jgi:hypothetical protein